jgi:autotransporter translocation and assembly factor TamB
MKDPEDNEKMLEELKKSVPSSLRNLFVNVQVDLNNDNWFTFLTSSLLMKGGITVAGRIPELALSGEVDLYRGTLNLPFLETPFKVYQGKAYFDGQDWSPSLALEAEADIGNYRVYMDYTGKMENPRVELTSEPPMRQDELQRMITGGAPGAPGAPGVPGMSSSFVLSGELAANAMATRLAERVMDLNLIQPLFHAIGRTFGLSDVALEYTYDGFWSVRVAKALDARERLLVTYDRVLLTNGVTQNLYGIEYRFQRGMLVRVSQDDQGRYYYWVQTKYRF